MNERVEVMVSLLAGCPRAGMTEAEADRLVASAGLLADRVLGEDAEVKVTVLGCAEKPPAALDEAADALGALLKRYSASWLSLRLLEQGVNVAPRTIRRIVSRATSVSRGNTYPAVSASTCRRVLAALPKAGL